MKKIILLNFLLAFVVLTAAPNGNYVFQLESATQAEIDANMGGTPTKGMMIYNTTNNQVYHYNGTQWVTLNCKVPVLPKTASYTLVLGDNNALLTFDSTSDVTLTVPSGLPVGYNVSVYQINTGKVTIVGSGTTVLNRLSRFKTAGKDAGIGIVSTATDTYHTTGDLKK